MELSPQQALSGVALQTADCPLGQVQYRSAGEAQAVTHVLLHGIGSGSASWAYQLAAAKGQAHLKVLAWDAPGYARSAPLAQAQPLAKDYAMRLWDWLDTLGVHQPVCLVGHSLGALMGASAALLAPGRVSRLVLLAPARGYGNAPAHERMHTVNNRLATLQQLGPQGMANARASAMLSAAAPNALIDAVRETMAQINPAGYTQAVHMLGTGRLVDDVGQLTCPVVVASGEQDTITPPPACDEVARASGTTRLSLGTVGHACTLEAAHAIHQLLGWVPMPSPVGVAA